MGDLQESEGYQRSTERKQPKSRPDDDSMTAYAVGAPWPMPPDSVGISVVAPTSARIMRA
jgi:hypothetical protein